MRKLITILFAVSIAVCPLRSALAGSLDSPAAPSNDAGRMYTLEQIYDVAAGNEAVWPAKPSGGFNEPATGPGVTMHSLDDIQGMIIAGVTTGTAADLDSGKTLLSRGAGTGETLVTGTGYIVEGGGTGTVAAASQVWTGYRAWNDEGVLVQGSAQANDYGLPKTGQTVVYTAGDDGTYQTGWSGTRFTDNGDGTISDNATGLMWIESGYADTDTTPATAYAADGSWREYTWANAILYCERLDYAGHTDWRLPNVKELQSIVDYSQSSPAIDEGFFTNTKSNYYWSGTTDAPNTVDAWGVFFSMAS